MLRFNIDTSKGETPASIAQKRALIAQLMGSAKSPQNLGEGFSAIGDGIVANVLGGRAADAESKGQESANSTFSALTGMLTGQGTPDTSYGSQTASDATAALAGGDFMSGLINSESGGNWGALNSEGYGGRLQFGDARLADAAAAGVIAPGVTGAEFSRMSPEQQQAVEAWHFGDIEQQAQGMGLDRYYGQTIAGVPITPESVKAMAHLGGIGGAQKFITSGGQYNPADSNGTRLSDYGSRFGGSSAPAAPVQVASLDPSIGAPAQLPPIGPTGGPQLTPMPQQTAQAAPMAAPAPQQAAPAPVQTAQGPSLQMLMEAAANPWLNDSQKGIINSMIAQEMQKQDPMYQLQTQAAQQGLTKGQLEIDAMLNPARETTEINGRLVYKDTGELVADYSDPNTVTVGNSVIDLGTGQPIYEGQPEPTSNMQDYEAYAADERFAGREPIGRLQYEQEVRKAGASNISVGGPGEIGTIPPDYELITDPVTGARSMQVIPGSPSDRKAQAEAAATAEREANSDVTAANAASIVIEDIDRALDQVSGWTAGAGSLLANVPGTGAVDLSSSLDTIKANIGFDRLQQMREASPTGGALGGIAVEELRMLQSVMGSLNTAQTPDQLKANLARLKEVYEPIAKKAAAYPNAGQFGFTGGTPNQSQANPGVVDFSDYFK